MTGLDFYSPQARARRRAIARRLGVGQRHPNAHMPRWWIRRSWTLMSGKNKAVLTGIYDTVHRAASCPESDLNIPWRLPAQIGEPAAIARIADHPHMRLCTHCFTDRELELMAIHNLDPRLRELGRIRIGRQVPTGKEGKTRPEKLDRFRFTSSSEKLIRAVSIAYGGQPREWTPDDGRKQWEVITDATSIPILIPPQPISQFYEQWAGGGCQRRCDGIRELLTDQPCICQTNGQDGPDRDCKPTTRINVICRDIPGVGMFRLESHGYYAAIELPQLAVLLERAAATNYDVEASLGLEERVIKRPGQGTRRFMVPTIELDITPAQLLAGEGRTAIGGAPSQRAELPVGPADDTVADAEVVTEPTDPREAAYQARRELDAVADTLEMGQVQLAREYAKTNGHNLVDADADAINAFRQTLEQRLDDFVRGQA